MGLLFLSVERARQLRKSLTPHEARLWVQLRLLKREGFHFRRQAPLLGYYPDFACFKHRLIVELDGSGHAEDAQRRHDARRDAVFRDAGFTTLRIWNTEVDDDIDGVVRKILAALDGSGPHPSASQPPSP